MDAKLEMDFNCLRAEIIPSNFEIIDDYLRYKVEEEKAKALKVMGELCNLFPDGNGQSEAKIVIKAYREGRLGGNDRK